jgi:hypothetical protein
MVDMYLGEDCETKDCGRQLCVLTLQACSVSERDLNVVPSPLLCWDREQAVRYEAKMAPRVTFKQGQGFEIFVACINCSATRTMIVAINRGQR